MLACFRYFFVHRSNLSITHPRTASLGWRDWVSCRGGPVTDQVITTPSASLCESSTGLPALAVDRVMSEMSNLAYEDHVLFVGVGPADHVTPRVVSFGKDFQPGAREPII